MLISVLLAIEYILKKSMSLISHYQKNSLPKIDYWKKNVLILFNLSSVNYYVLPE